MSIFSRWFGPRTAERSEPESLRAIAARLGGVPAERAHFVAAFAYALARVAQADMEIDDLEIRAMEETLAGRDELDAREARVVVEIAVSQVNESGASDNYLVVREFKRVSAPNERVQLMRCLLAVAASDERISTAESSVIHQIGEELGFTRAEVNGLRLEWRDKLAELSSTPSDA